VIDLFSVAGRVAVVTGGASGIGRAIGLGLHAAGATLVTLDRASAAGDTELHAASASAIELDITDRASVARAAEEVLDRFGPAHILVNSAGIGGRASARDYDPELFARVVSVNLAGTFHCCQLFGRQMLDAGRGSIINISSIGAMVGIPGSVGYQASKGAVAQMTRALAVEWAPGQVRVNAIAPGHTETPLVQRQWEREPELKEYFLSRTPLGRIARAEDMVGAALFLASGASAMVTGQTITVDGGYTVL
jgi:NAD(P)-dependent dehydrogenase (short-subunit alcohol dehydrogenase family)